MTALIVLGGDAPKKALLERGADACDLVIAADRGLEAFVQTDIVPDVLVGDMDSVSPDVLRRYSGVPQERLNCVKDDTDAEHALGVAVRRGASYVSFLGALGGRLDHALANLMLLVKAHEMGVGAQILDDGVCIRHVKDRIVLHGKPGDTVSVLPLGQAEGVTLRGFYYPLSDYTLTSNTSLGVSNVMTQREAEVIVKRGDVIVFHYSKSV